jgi:hypothetical protein
MEDVTAAVVQEIMAALVPIVVATVLALAGWLAELLRRMHINSTVARAIGRGVGAAYLSLLEQRRGADPSAIARAQEAAVDFVMGGPTVAPLLPKAGISPERLQEIVRAEIGLALVKDQGVSVGLVR